MYLDPHLIAPFSRHSLTTVKARRRKRLLATVNLKLNRFILEGQRMTSPLTLLTVLVVPSSCSGRREAFMDKQVHTCL